MSRKFDNREDRLNNLTEEEIESLYTEQGAASVLMGYLKTERGKIAPSVFNKLFMKLGYPKYNKKKLMERAEEIEDFDSLESLYTKAFHRELRLEDIPNVVAEPEKIEEENVFSHVTNFIVDNEDNNARLREMRKLQRSGAHMDILMKNLKKHMASELKGMPTAKYLKTDVPTPKHGDKNLVVLLSDWHIGLLVKNETTGGFDFKKLTTTIQSVSEQIRAFVVEWNIDHVHIFFVGDLIEHISMRNVNQAFDAEFPATEQIAKGQRLLVDLLMETSKHVHVTFGMVAGNHDRFDGNKNDKVYNDTATYIVLDSILFIQRELKQLPNVTIIDNRKDTYEFTHKVAGKTFKVTHGDTEKKKEDHKIPKHIREEPIDYLIMGHIHTNRIIQEDYSRYHVYVSSPVGGNNFSKELNFPDTQGSQMMMILTEGSDSPMFAPLMLDKGGHVK